MKRFGIKISLAIIAIFSLFSAYADGKVSFTTSAPRTVAKGETFRVEFSLNAKDDSNSFHAPTFEGFDVLAGPARSTGSSVQIINGSMTKSVNVSYTYVLTAQKEGNITISSATVSVDSKKYKTNPFPIEVVKEDANQAQSGHNQSGDRANSIAEDDILLRTDVSKTSVFKGQPLRATIKIYSRANIVGAEGQKIPSFNGFWAQNIKSDQSEIQRETYNGKVYDTQVLCDYLLYPQQSGKLTIEPAELDIVAQVVVRSNRRIDPFFGGGNEVYNVKRKVVSPKVTVDVRELPAGAPASFSGAVGEFTMESNISNSTIATNSSLQYTVRVSGTGNLSFVQAPTINLPTSFEQYNVKTTESINTTLAGASGYKQFEYPIIPRSEGEYKIDPVEFSYFNPRTMQYTTLQTKAYTLNVTPDGSGESSNETAHVVRGLTKEDVKLLGKDIRFIKLGNGELVSKVEPFILSTAYFITLFGIFALFIGLFIFIKRHIKDSKNFIAKRGKHANKVAVQRFKAAKNHMNDQNERAFYEEVLRALWGYMSDKFNIPVANLTKESVREELHKRGVSSTLLPRFSEVVTMCDEAQYSPMASAQMNEVYIASLELISQIETEIKR